MVKCSKCNGEGSYLTFAGMPADDAKALLEQHADPVTGHVPLAIRMASDGPLERHECDTCGGSGEITVR